MTDRRPFILLALAVLLAAWGAWHLYAGWGLVSLDVRDAPVDRVLASISRQGGIDIASNLPRDTTVTLKVKRVPPVEALDIVAVRTDTSWRLAYLGAPDRAAIEAALSAFRLGNRSEGWTSYGSGGFSLVAPESGQALDLRGAVWTPEGSGNLPTLLQEAADETGVMLAAPTDWQPAAAPPPAGAVAKSIPTLFRRAGGTAREVFLLRAQPSRDDNAGGGSWGGGPWIGRRAAEDPDGGGGWMRTLANPERIARRAEAQIALLPAADQPRAREELAVMSRLWEEVRDLPEAQRAAKAREFFSSPEMQERMEERRLTREAKMTPEQRIDRSRRYFERKKAAQAGRNTP
jgi:hypothetical protein